jgi:hypothetical protein
MDDHSNSGGNRPMWRDFDSLAGPDLRTAYEDVAAFVRWLDACDIRVPSCWYTHGWVVRRLDALRRWYDEVHNDESTGRASADWWLVGVGALCRDWSDLMGHRGRHVPADSPLADPQPVPSLEEWIQSISEEGLA